jgi:RNA polymerase sigma-70 factor (ECF subfamily)
MATDDDRPLVEAAQADPARFAELYDRHMPRVYAYVRRRAADKTMAEDVTSDVFQHALANLRQFEWRGAPFLAWLLRIAANTLTDRWRKESRGATEVVCDPPDPHEADEIERRVMLAQLVDRLPEAQRQVVQMRFAQERSIREIAAALGRSEGAVKQLQLRALEHLRKEMSGRG